MNRRIVLKMMDNRKTYNAPRDQITPRDQFTPRDVFTPRERIDDRLLLQLLNEEAQADPGLSCGGYAVPARFPKVQQTPRQVPAAGAGTPSPRCSGDQPSAVSEPESGCASSRNPLSGMPLSMVYAPEQEWRELYGDEDALDHGTLFRELDLPFLHGCLSRGNRSCGCGENQNDKGVSAK